MKPDRNEIDIFNDVYLIMPKMETTLAKVIRSKQKLTDRHYQYFLYQILRGLKYIHSTGIIHCNLKPKHILINGYDCNVKISHFICAHIIDRNNNNNNNNNNDNQDDINKANRNFSESGYVNRWYRSPERLCCFNNINLCDEKIDIWSVGCIFAELMARRPIFPGTSHLDQLKTIFEILGTPKDLSWIKTSVAKKWIKKLKPKCGKDLTRIFRKGTPSALYLLQKLLIFDQRKRISANDALKHEYFSQCEIHCPEKEIQGYPVDFGVEFENISKTKFGLRC